MKVSLEFLTLLITGSDKPSSSSKSLFELLYTEEGFNNVKKWFEEKAVQAKDRRKYIFNENHFISFMRRLTDFNDYEILEIMDFFDTRQDRTISFKEFFLLISMLAARDSGQATQFLYLHNKEIFDILCNNVNQIINFERFSRLGFVMGIPEEFLQSRLKDYNVTTFGNFDHDQFLLYYFDILSSLDNYRKRSKIEGDANSSDKNSKCIIS